MPSLLCYQGRCLKAQAPHSIFMAMTFCLPAILARTWGFQGSFHFSLNFIQTHKEASVLNTNLRILLAPSDVVFSLAQVHLLEQ